MSRNKSWSEKLHNGAVPEVKTLGKGFQGFPAGASLLIPSPTQIYDYLSTIPVGEVRDSVRIRADLAKEAGADTTCPLCTGIFTRICAEYAFEQIENGKSVSEVAPFWRAIPAKAPIRKKLSFGTELIDSLQAEEAASLSR